MLQYEFATPPPTRRSPYTVTHTSAPGNRPWDGPQSARDGRQHHACLSPSPRTQQLTADNHSAGPSRRGPTQSIRRRRGLLARGMTDTPRRDCARMFTVSTSREGIQRIARAVYRLQGEQQEGCAVLDPRVTPPFCCTQYPWIQCFFCTGGRGVPAWTLSSPASPPARRPPHPPVILDAFVGVLLN